jgi:sugar-specific transcriptional regulator TrmB
MQPNIEHVRQEVRATVEWLRANYPGLEDDEKTWIDTLEGQSEIKEVAAKLIDRALDCKAMTAALKLRADDIAARKRRLDDQEKSLRNAVMILMQEAGVKKLELPEATLSVRDTAPRLIVTDDAAIPDTCCETVRKIVMDKVKAAVEAFEADKAQRAMTDIAALSETFPGVEWSNGGASLTVRTK